MKTENGELKSWPFQDPLPESEQLGSSLQKDSPQNKQRPAIQELDTVNNHAALAEKIEKLLQASRQALDSHPQAGRLGHLAGQSQTSPLARGARLDGTSAAANNYAHDCSFAEKMGWRLLLVFL